MNTPRRLFIANRGEIARRIAITARRLGIETVALSDATLPPHYLSDVATHIVKVDHETPALYLDSAKMVQYALAARCDSLHPGFGFLSENATFAAAVGTAGLTWVGPNPGAIAKMGSKASARTCAERVGVPCIEGLAAFPVPEGEHGDFAILAAFADKTGYPLLIKAAMGGGGKGMRIVRSGAELRPAALRARSEALSSFGDGSLICERYLESPRHVEVQVLADRHGMIVALGERDCSLQRRHQKIFEEAPAPDLPEKTRRALHAAAVRLARETGYDSTGTVEFLVDWGKGDVGSDDLPFYFLEMNTRLQVEHTVTEEVFGLDLVEWQLRVAAGERLPEHFAALKPRGASIEVRLYAEDPNQGFLPTPGPVAYFSPATGPGVRWETGLDATDEITGHFDPMIAKLIVYGETRLVAVARLAEALGRTFFAGPPANLELLGEMMRRSDLAHGPVTTHYLGAHLDELLRGLNDRRARFAELAARLLSLVENAGGGSVTTHGALERSQAIFRTNGAKESAPAEADAVQVVLESTVTLGSKTTRIGRGRCEFGGNDQEIAFAFATQSNAGRRQGWVLIDGHVFTKVQEDTEDWTPSSGGGSTLADIVAPVPGRVVAVKVRSGQAVAQGDTLFILESMKMEFEIKAGRDGVVAAICVNEGQQVGAAEILAGWQADASPTAPL